ncbi:MAG: antibiotic biosynthesis monooxygenase [Pseudomonadota bacterium]
MTDPTPVTLSTVRIVRSGCEVDFEKALHDFVQRSLQLPGQLGVHIMRPAPGSESREYGIIRKFADRDSLQNFRSSALYGEWSTLVKGLTDGDARAEELSGLESWFTLPGAALQPLPKWKMASVTFIGVYPISTILGQLLGPLTSEWHFLVRNVLISGCIVVLLTWLVMPLLTRALHGWLHKNSRK